MKKSMPKQNTLDRLISFFSPSLAERRALSRYKAAAVRAATYAASTSPRGIGYWNPADSNVNDIIEGSGQQVRARIRQLVRDYPNFRRAVNVIKDFTVGSGIKYQARIKNPDGTLNDKLNQMAEDGWKWFCDEADISGKLHLYEMMRIDKGLDIEAGEFLLIKRYVRKPSKYVPFCIQQIEPDWLTDYNIKPFRKQADVEKISLSAGSGSGKSIVNQGIEFDANTGAVIGYHFQDPDSWGTTIRVRAENVIHGFETLRPGQVRGISPFVSGVLVSRDLGDWIDTEIDTGKMASKWLAFVTKADPGGMQSFMKNMDAAYEDDDGALIEELENGIIEYLQPGEKVDLASNPRPNSAFTPFAQFLLKMLSAGTGVPYELLTSDYQGLNYSVSRTVRNDFKKFLDPIIARHVFQWCQPVQRAWMDSAVMAGRFPFRTYFTDPRPFWESYWQAPGMPAVDPLKETKADIDAMINNLRSPQEIVTMRGRDLEDIYKEIAEAKRLREKYGITEQEALTSTAIGNSPSAIEDQEGGGDDEDMQKNDDARHLYLIN